ncbi:CNOT2 isoform 37 [Pan troglodytes]|uniref:CCR4-NOT transcription complex subunit 2 n=2 Tax=Homininae TaxID=207598 RepID=F8VV05_HUMAN|nr:CCR4-NOT transcription complex subunit 2 [Homo sapiens]KAI4067250.1 CCR4-NOT transcription complex subunit 2 [Homo sapiens]PNI29958.1 CNOT2 isoform 37 [Pan troglodytes]
MVRTDGHTLSEKRNYQPPALSFPIPRVANVERSCTDVVSLCHPGWTAVASSWLTATSASQVQVILLPRPPSSWDYR